MPGIPPTIDSDTEDVAWALQTAEALWKRNERSDALVWLRRAAQAAGEAEDDDRALALARDAAELAEWLAQSASAGDSTDETPVMSEAAGGLRDPEGVAETLAPPPPDDHVATAAEAHAGMLDPWADAEAPTHQHAPVPSPAETAETPAAPQAENDGVVTSAPTGEPPRLDLAGVEALADLPDDAREAFAGSATMRDLGLGDEVSGFALALVIEGSVDLAATIADTPARRLEAGAILRSRGTIERATPVRLIGASDRARIATWDDRDVTAGFRACPWVEDDLRAAADRDQALVGVTLGPLGERLDPDLRADVTGRLVVRALAEGEVCAKRGEPVPGLLVIGGGEIELLGDDGAPQGPVLTAGDFLFAAEALRAARAPRTARAAKGGALVFVAERGITQELFVTCPPLLEIFAGM